MKLNEVVIEYHNTLNPKLWDKNDIMKTDVRIALVKIAKAFIDFLEIDNSFIEDVILTGSNCNYNWTNDSDLDIHVIVNYDDFQKSCNTVDIEEMFFAKKSLWNTEHDITIYDIPTELYVQNSAQTLPKNAALFSLGKNIWIKAPQKISNFEVDEKLINDLYFPIKKEIKNIIKNKNKNIAYINALKDKIKKLRKDGLAKNGEFSLENLVFKKLRNNGYMEKLYNYSNSLENKELSLD